MLIAQNYLRLAMPALAYIVYLVILMFYRLQFAYECELVEVNGQWDHYLWFEILFLFWSCVSLAGFILCYKCWCCKPGRKSFFQLTDTGAIHRDSGFLVASEWQGRTFQAAFLNLIMGSYLVKYQIQEEQVAAADNLSNTLFLISGVLMLVGTIIRFTFPLKKFQAGEKKGFLMCVAWFEVLNYIINGALNIVAFAVQFTGETVDQWDTFKIILFLNGLYYTLVQVLVTGRLIRVGVNKYNFDHLDKNKSLDI